LSIMFDGLFIDSDVENLFTDKAIVHAMLRFEAALALAQADADVISFDHARLIASVCESAEIDLEKMILAAQQAGNPAIPLVKELTTLVRKTDAHAAGLVHAGATSQDLIDTATMLQLKAALSKLDLGITRLQQRLTELISEHRETVMIGRTLLQQARPITFAFKLAGWLDQLIRCRGRIREVRARGLVLQFGGAVGTLAANGHDALRIMSRLAQRLELAEPTMPWHTARDRLFEVASALAMLTGCLGKIATDASLLMQTEVGEISEAAEEGRGGSSAMPHKRNPVAPTIVIAACSRVPGLLATMSASMMQEHERSVGRWHAEWSALPEIVCLASGAVKHAVDLFSRLEVNVTSMRQNIDMTRGLIFAESIAVALGKEIGKSEAEELVKMACQRARKKNCHLHQVLLKDPTVSRVLDQASLEQIFRPENALGTANELIDRVLKQAAASEPRGEQ
jgi:3-carboxy-cis,cis-muconate cycloisomerase